MRRMLCAAVAAVVSIPAIATAAPITVDFEGVAVSPGNCADGSAYLASFGITFSAVTSGTTANICNADGSGVIPVSGSNVFFGLPDVTNTNLSYDLIFATPQSEISFTRATVPSFTALPPWQVRAYDASDALLSTISFPTITFPGTPAEVLTLAGPNLVRLRVDAFNSAHVTYNHPPFDDLVIDAPAAPEPTSLVLLGSGLGALGWVRRRRAGRSR